MVPELSFSKVYKVCQSERPNTATDTSDTVLREKWAGKRMGLIKEAQTDPSFNTIKYKALSI
jgi:hypothetical protein